MDVSNKPMETIEQWQEWYRKHRTVAQLDEPLVSKDSREKLHDTSNATDTMPDWRGHYAQLISDGPAPMVTPDNSIYKQKATEHFADTLCEFQNELTGAEFYECFLAAATEICDNAKIEYDKTKELVNLFTQEKTGEP